ncbi:MAG: cytochrome C [Candidatus Neomarinimicrobiota bacterium]|nr:MAG: cytochrome C [Candidatus Neomarinimicrobiota bacterium]
MRKVIALGLSLGLLSALSAQTIVGSDHDFSGKNWNNTGEICVVCHTPHNADNTVNGAPLWNHQVTSSNFTTYSSATFDATSGQPDGASKLCLSCHDGTVALDNFGGKTNGTNYVGGSKNFGTDLTNDHPISFTYDDALASTDGELNAPSTTNSGLGGTIADDLLIGGKMECASCHDVHNTVAVNGTKLLVKSNANSALCLTCHAK